MSFSLKLLHNNLSRYLSLITIVNSDHSVDFILAANLTGIITPAYGNIKKRFSLCLILSWSGMLSKVANANNTWSRGLYSLFTLYLVKIVHEAYKVYKYTKGDDQLAQEQSKLQQVA